MKNIVVLFAGGWSTRAMVNEMQKEAKSMGKSYCICAYPLGVLKEVKRFADCILVGPQIAFHEKKIKQDVDCPVANVSTKLFEKMDGKGTLEIAMRLMEECS